MFHPIEPLRRDAELIVPLLPRCRSVVDFGCNNGQWLKAFNDLEVTDVVGIDGEGVVGYLTYRGRFIQHDLTQPLSLHRTFDLALCIEVAEHLPEIAADTLLDTLALHSETVVFSAATPGQGGFAHLNEQPFDYWEAKFKDRGYGADLSIRYVLPTEVAWWLRANLAVFERN